MIERYKKYLEFIDKSLTKMFKSQTPFIKCKKGCAYCCKEGEYPISELEYVYLMLYYNELDENIKVQIDEKISKLVKNSRTKMYECPFLINDTCTVYPARAIICRTFGLISYDKNHKKRIPFCVNIGLNYSNVFDKEKNKIIKKSEDGIEPLAFNIERNYLRNKNFEKEFNLYFGEDKALIEWLREEFE